MKYYCELCGYEYDEEVEETEWEDVPENFECPLCGASKDDFSEEYE